LKIKTTRLKLKLKLQLVRAVIKIFSF